MSKNESKMNYHPSIHEIANILKGPNIGYIKLLFKFITSYAGSKGTLIQNEVKNFNVFIDFVIGVIELIVKKLNKFRKHVHPKMQ